MWGQSPHLKKVGWDKAPPLLGCFCAYIVVVEAILPTQKPRFPPVVHLDCWVVLGDYLILQYLVLWFFTIFGVIFDVKTTKIETELSPIG